MVYVVEWAVRISCLCRTCGNPWVTGEAPGHLVGLCKRAARVRPSTRGAAHPISIGPEHNGVYFCLSGG